MQIRHFNAPQLANAIRLYIVRPGISVGIQGLGDFNGPTLLVELIV